MESLRQEVETTLNQMMEGADADTGYTDPAKLQDVDSM
jgi:hypothetical protein